MGIYLWAPQAPLLCVDHVVVFVLLAPLLLIFWTRSNAGVSLGQKELQRRKLLAEIGLVKKRQKLVTTPKPDTKALARPHPTPAPAPLPHQRFALRAHRPHQKKSGPPAVGNSHGRFNLPGGRPLLRYCDQPGRPAQPTTGLDWQFSVV